MTVFELAGKLKLDSSEFSSSLNKQESAFKNFGNKLSAWTIAKGQMLERFTEKAVGSLANFMKSSVQSSMSFNKAMSQVAATMGKTTDQIKELSDFARKMGAETAFTAEEAAQGLNYMALAGYDAETSMKMLPQVLNLAAAGNFELARASDMVTDAQSALGLSISDTEKLVDQMAKTASKTNTSVEQLGDAMLTVGGTAKNLKGGTAELSAVLGVLADNGIKGSEGGTALRNVLLSLSAPTSNASKQIKKLGLDIFDSKGNMRGIDEIMTDLNEAMKDMTQEQRTNTLSDIFNKRDLKAVEALLGTSELKWKDLTKEIRNSKGAAEDMAETQLDNLAGDVTKFKSALGEAKIALVEGLTPNLRRFVQIGTRLIQRLTNAFKKDGLKGAIEEAKKIFNDFIENLQNSDNPVLQKVGQALATIRDVMSHVYRLFTDFDSEIQRLRESDSPVLHLIAEALVTVRDGIDGIIKLIKGDWIGAVRTFRESDSEILKTVAVIADTFDQGRQRIVGFIDAVKEAFGVAGSGGKLYKSYAEKMSHSYNDVNDEESRKKWLSDLGVGLQEAGFTAGQISTIKKRFEGFGYGEEDKKGMQASLLQLAGVGAPYGVDTLIKEWDELNSRQPTYFSEVEEQLVGVVNRLKELEPLMKEEHPIAIEVEPETPEEKLKKENEKLQQFYNDHPLHQQLEVRRYYVDGLPQAEKFFHNAKGNWSVPYDNYPALLHRDEMVLNKSQARRYRDGEQAAGNGTDMVKALADALSKVLILMDGDKVGDLTTKRVKNNINANSYSRIRAYGG